MNNASAPKLAAPGAGVPFFQRIFFRYYLAPFVAKKSDWDRNLKLFMAMHDKYMSLIKVMDEQTLVTPVLIPPQTGLEDSSRFWSPIMVLEHLNIVNRAFLELIVSLSQGVAPAFKADTARVKPTGTLPPQQVIDDFVAFNQALPEVFASRIADRNNKVTFEHPWFGLLNVLQWQWVLAVHMGIHLKQLREIIKHG